MQISANYKLIAFGVLSTLLAIVFHPFLPDKSLRIYPAENVTSLLYADEASGGKSQASWISAEHLHWRCDVREGATHRYCGFHIDFAGGTDEGLDLSPYTAVKVKLAVKTNDRRMRIYVRNFEEGFSREGDVETAKFNNILLSIAELEQELTVGLDEFSVAEWWINERNVPRHLASPNFDNVLTVGIDLGVPPGIGVHEVKLERLEFIGEWVSAEHWYRGLLFIWMGIIVLIGLVRHIGIKRRLILEQMMLKELASDNVKLQDETEKYRELSSIDNLTGVLNRRGFDEAFAELQASVSVKERLALLILDLDHFKTINDTLGHDVGDKVLKSVAETIAKNVRHSDKLARWGGEEFVVLCPNISSQGAAILAEKLRTVVAVSEFSLQSELRVTVSVGVSSFKIQENFEHLFRRTDAALYEAKKGGRNRVVKADK